MPRHPPCALHSLSPHTQTNTTKTPHHEPPHHQEQTRQTRAIRARGRVSINNRTTKTLLQRLCNTDPRKTRGLVADARVHYPKTKQPKHKPHTNNMPSPVRWPDFSGPNSVPTPTRVHDQPPEGSPPLPHTRPEPKLEPSPRDEPY
jgi:hypothetical protein